jgi:poly(A) polymerase
MLLGFVVKILLVITRPFRSHKDKVSNHSASLTKVTPLQFNKERKKWEHVTKMESFPAPNSMKIATHNVLKTMDWLFEWVVRSPERFAKEVEVLKALDADIISLNEVTGAFMKVLQEQQWVKDSYYLSDAVDGETAINSTVEFKTYMGNVILSRVPFKDLHAFTFSSDLKLSLKPIIGTFFDNNTTLCSAHTTSQQENTHRRANEMKQLVSYLPNPNTIILGDLNLHLTSEDTLIPEIGYKDLWSPTEDEKDGFTWDTKLNTMLAKMLVSDKRRMRLDRILAKEGAQWKCDEHGVRIFAKEPVYEGGYLTCSDHFGLVANLIQN